ncbi:MAG: bacteriohemerythrin [Clostridia bacterium]|nr:bacteriohemerythrin [Clostridia bacterium]
MGVQWKDSLAIGVGEIDNQHKQLFEAVDKLFTACTERKGKEEVGNTVKFLEDYVVTHFNDEEKIMQNCDYPQYDAHKQQHEQFIKDFSELKNRFEEEGPTVYFVSNINRTVVDWLIKHIGSSDKALGAFLKAKQ